MHGTAPRRSSVRALALGALVTVAATRPAPGVTANSVFAVSGLPGLEAISLRQIGAALRSCAIAGPAGPHAGGGAMGAASRPSPVDSLPAVGGPGRLAGDCSITVTRLVG